MKLRILPAALVLLGLVQSASAVVIMVDVDSTHNETGQPANPIITQPGFTSYDAGSGAGGVTAERSMVVDGVTIDFFGGIDGSRHRDETDVPSGGGGGGEYDALLRDFVFNDGNGAAVAIRLTGLPLGTYDVTSWHWDSLPGTPGVTQVEVRNPGGAASRIILADEVPFSQDPIRYQITVDQEGEVLELVFRDDDAITTSGRSRLNGFIIETVPEPTSAAVMGMGALALCLRRRR